MVKAEVVEVEVGRIVVGEFDVRGAEDDPQQEELCRSIMRLGVLNPLVGRVDGDKVVVVAGHRRFRAAVEVGLKTVPMRMIEGELIEGYAVSFAENLARRDLSPLELAAGVADAIEKGGFSVERIAMAVGRSIEWVERQVRILAWPPELLAAVHGGQLSVAAAENLALVEEGEYRCFLLGQAVSQGATARVTASWLQGWRAALPVAQVVGGATPAAAQRLPAMAPQAVCWLCSKAQDPQGMVNVLVCLPCLQAIRAAQQKGVAVELDPG